MKTKKILPLAVLPLLLSLFTGCTSMSLKKPDVWPLNIEDNKPGKPTQIVTNWTDTILYPSGETPVRGFGGRVMFYTEGKKEPVKVEGTLVVYAFDEKNRDPQNAKPDRKFVFTKEQLAKHYSKSKLGHSYSVWLPWDNAGGDQKEVSLIVRFVPEKGNVVVSDPAKQVLPGKIESIANNSPSYPAPISGAIQPVSFEYATNAPVADAPRSDNRDDASRNMTTTTIAVPPASLKSPIIFERNPRASVPQAATADGFNRQAAGGITPSIPNGQSANAGVAAPMQAYNPTLGAGINPAIPRISPAQPQSRSGSGQLPALGASYGQSNSYRAPMPPNPSTPAFGPGAAPGSATNCGLPGYPEAAGSPLN
jgi:hypothetical protein